jgi:hypothetical protein
MHDQLIATLKQVVTPPEYGSEVYNKWLDQESFLKLLKDNQSDPYVILYAGLGHLAIFPLVIPMNALDAADRRTEVALFPWILHFYF